MHHMKSILKNTKGYQHLKPVWMKRPYISEKLHDIVIFTQRPDTIKVIRKSAKRNTIHSPKIADPSNIYQKSVSTITKLSMTKQRRCTQSEPTRDTSC